MLPLKVSTSIVWFGCQLRSRISTEPLKVCASIEPVDIVEPSGAIEKPCTLCDAFDAVRR